MKNKFPHFFKKYIEFILLYLIYLTFLILSIKFATSSGGFFFKLIGPFTNTQKIVKKNLKQIYPNIKKIESKNKSKLSWYNTGKTFFELLVLSKIIQNNIITIEGGKY